MGKVVKFRGITTLDVDPKDILEELLEMDLKGVVVVGYLEDGSEFFSSSWADAAQAVWALQRGIYQLNKKVDELAEEQ